MWSERYFTCIAWKISTLTLQHILDIPNRMKKYDFHFRAVFLHCFYLEQIILMGDQICLPMTVWNTNCMTREYHHPSTLKGYRSSLCFIVDCIWSLFYTSPTQLHTHIPFEMCLPSLFTYKYSKFSFLWKCSFSVHSLTNFPSISFSDIKIIKLDYSNIEEIEKLGED